MTWDELLAAYRDLGGIAENVRLDEGAYGRGVFVIDPSRPARLHTPQSLYVPVEDIEYDEATMTVKPHSTVAPQAREFFDLYQRHFGWSAGGFEAYRAQQAAWHALDPEIARAIGAISQPPPWRFSAPSVEACAVSYITERYFNISGKRYIVPMIDLVNHAGSAAPYTREGGFGVAGTFADEMLVSYNDVDPWAHMLFYQFASPAPLACSLTITITLANGRKLVIERSTVRVVSDDRLHFPTVETNGDVTTISFVILGFTPAMDLPRTVFRRVTAALVPQSEADQLFESLQHFNRMKFLELLRVLRKHDGALVHALEDAVLYQLEALSAAVGVRA